MPIAIEEVIARIPDWAAASSLDITPLPGGTTNVNYRVDVDGNSFVVRIATESTSLLGIDRHLEYQCTVAASRTGVAPDVVHFLPDLQVLVTRFISGRCPSATEMRTPEMLTRVVESMRRYHEGPRFDGSFSPFPALEQYLLASRRYGAPLPRDIDAMYRLLSKIEGALRRAPPVIHPCHNDLWEPNLIDDGARIRIVDWEYAGMGDVYFDLANFAIHHDFSDPQDEGLLHRRFGVIGPGLARLKLMKIVAELREAMWCMVGMNLLSVEFDFVGYATTHFERYRQALDDPRLPVWLLEASISA